MKKEAKKEEASKGRYASQGFTGGFKVPIDLWRAYPGRGGLLSPLASRAWWKGPLRDPSAITRCYFFQASVSSARAGRAVHAVERSCVPCLWDPGLSKNMGKRGEILCSV